MDESKFTGMVIYCDGSAKPNPGDGGYAYHGYLYRLASVKPKAVVGKDVPTCHGYVPIDQAVQWDDVRIESWLTPNIPINPVEPVTVEVLRYLDGLGTSPPNSSNNYGELRGLIQALKMALKCKVNYLRIKSDSSYAGRGFTDNLDQWARTGYVTASNQPVKNRGLWEMAYEFKQQLRMQGTVIEVEWVEGHADLLGNELADQAATMARYKAAEINMVGGGDLVEHDVESEPTSDYWGSATRHPMIVHPYMYFVDDGVHAPPGTNRYFFGTPGKNQDFLGCRTSDAAFCVVDFAEVQPKLDVVLTRAAQHPTGSFVKVELSKLYTTELDRQHRLYGTMMLGRGTSTSKSMVDASREDVVSAVQPPLCAFDAMELFSMLMRQFEAFYIKQKDPNSLPSTWVEDLTHYFYSRVEVPSKKKNGTPTIKNLLNDTITQNDTTITVSLPYYGGNVNLKLVMGHALPNRNVLKKLEGLNPKVHLVYWGDERSFRYATIIKTDEATGIYSGGYTNLHVVF